VWVNHMLRPSMYREDCKRLLGEVIDHNIHLQTMYQSMNKKMFLVLTKKLYEDEFKEPYCDNAVIEAQHPKLIENTEAVLIWRVPPQPQEVPFNPIFTKEIGSVEETASVESNISLKVNDLMMDAGCIGDYKTYMSHCLFDTESTKGITSKEESDGTEYENPCRLKTNVVYQNLLKSYERFLFMVAKYPPQTGYVHPTFAIDVVWHSHIICPKHYESDIIRLVGFPVEHNPWPTITKKDTSESMEKTQNLWEKEFGNRIDLDHIMVAESTFVYSYD